jgi:hypothetical protein
LDEIIGTPRVHTALGEVEVWMDASIMIQTEE